MMMDFILKVAV